MDWFQRNHNRIDFVSDIISPEDLVKYNPAGKAGQLGDVSIKKFLDSQAGSGRYFVIVAEDGDLRALRGPHYRAVESTTGFIAEAIADKRLSFDEAQRLSKAIGVSSRLNNITPSDRSLIFDEADIKAHYENDFTPPGRFGKAAKLGFTVSALGLGATVLHKLGIIGDILTFGTTAAHAAVLRSEDKESEAKQLWVEYIFDVAGGIVGGAVGGYLAITTLKGFGGFWGPIIGAVAGSAAGSLGGAELGRYIYQEYASTFDNFLNDIYDFVDTIAGTPREFVDIYGDVTQAAGAFIDNPDAFIIGFAKKLGFEVDAASGSSGEDWLLATKWSSAFGGSGDDFLLGWRPTFVSAGETFDDGLRARSAAAWAVYDALVALGETPEPPRLERNAGVAATELRLQLDGGSGDDWILTIGGDGAITAGGLGRDWIFNTSAKGELYGDTLDGLTTGPDGNPAPVEDTRANGDNFWWWPDTTIMDAQVNDSLRFFGLPLVGGNSNVPTIALGAAMAVGGGGIGYFIFQNGVVNGKFDPTRQLYFDQLFPWMAYAFQREQDGSITMGVFNIFSSLIGGNFPDRVPDNPKTRGDESAQILEGNSAFMRVRNFDAPWSLWGADLLDGRRGKLGMAFKVANPFLALLAMLPPTLVSFAASGGGVLVDEALSLVAGIRRMAQILKMDNPGDPLVIDLDGDGIETVALSSASPYFDVDGDRFAEKTGWLKGDDGFLVVDANGNGRIDEVSEMFGDARQTGYAELRQHDGNGDGRITAADLIWSELRVWRGGGRDRPAPGSGGRFGRAERARRRGAASLRPGARTGFRLAPVDEPACRSPSAQSRGRWVKSK